MVKVPISVSENVIELILALMRVPGDVKSALAWDETAVMTGYVIPMEIHESAIDGRSIFLYRNSTPKDKKVLVHRKDFERTTYAIRYC